MSFSLVNTWLLYLIAIKSFNFGRQFWLNYKAYSFITNISELHSLWGFQICAALISSSNGFWVISVIIKGTKFPKSKGNSPNLIAIKSFNFGRQLWQKYKALSDWTNITELHLFWGLQICAALISSSNGFRVISIFVKVTKIPKSKGNSPNLIAIKSFNFERQLWQNYKAYSFVMSITGLHLFWGLQICASLISSSNDFWVIMVFV